MSGNVIRYALLAAVLGLGGGLVACEKHDNPAEKAMDNVQDGLNMRDHEKLKDTGEDLKDAGQDAGDAMKDEANEMKK